MKKGIIIAFCILAVMITACKKPVEPTPEPTNYAPDYVGSYLGSFTLSITSMNHQPQTLALPFDGITMDITEGEEINSITATVTVDNESHQTTGTATADKADFDTVHLVIDKPDQHYKFNLDLKMEGLRADSTMTISGSFSGNGNASFPTPQGMVEQEFEELSGTLSGILVKQ